jgi:large subunit ribosomal protein L31
MKADIHPKTHKVKFICSCGNVQEVNSTIKDTEVRMEVCSLCHPFYTGEQKILKTGAVDKFYARQKKMEELKNKARPL